jgi:drug/metabolite transporter (DMT)-like permease
LLGAVAVVLTVSPSRREILEGIMGRTFDAEDHRAVALSIYGAGPASPGITMTEFDGLRSMATVTRLESSGPHQVRAQPVNGITLAAITSEARARTGNRGFYAAWLSPEPRVMTSPAKVVWLFIALYGAFFLYTRINRRVTPQWLLYAGALACLHSVVSILAWAFAIQLWNCAS